MDKSRRNVLDRNLSIWLVVQSFIMIGAAIFAFLVVEFGSIYLYGNQATFNIGYILGLIIPLSTVLGALNFYLVKATYRYFTVLTDALAQISDGDFHVQIDMHNAGPFRPVYENFNKMSAELKNVHMLRNDFINSYSHEFKTPIVSIKGFADLLLETDVGEEERNAYLRIISDEAARLAELADSTILLSKLDAQRIIEDKRPYALDEQLRKCGIILSAAWGEKDIAFSCELDAVTYTGNEQLMQHLWLNLLSNAIKFTPRGGEIVVRLTQVDGEAVVRIEDSGIGMDAQTAVRIFDKYYQAEQRESRQGLGLGLSIVRRIVDLCEGRISVQSERGKGSAFVVALPNSSV